MNLRKARYPRRSLDLSRTHCAAGFFDERGRFLPKSRYIEECSRTDAMPCSNGNLIMLMLILLPRLASGSANLQVLSTLNKHSDCW